MKARFESTGMFNMPGMVAYGFRWYKNGSRADKKKAIAYMNALLFRGKDEPSAKAMLDGKLPYEVVDDAVEFDYCGDALNSISFNVTLRSSRPIDETTEASWRALITGAVNDLGFGRPVDVEVIGG